MAAAYDIYDYPSYWEGREYEHRAEILAISAFLQKISEIKNILEIGAGFARLTPLYLYRAKKVVLTDPSSKLLKLARERFPDKKIKYIQARLDNLPGKVKGKSINLVILVRVLHHIENLEEAFSITNKLLKKKGYFILEFPNKCHFKARFTEFLHGNFTFSIDISPKDIRSKKSKSKGTLPFINYHPDYIKQKLTKHGFKILAMRTVSNFRSSFLKKIIPLEALLFLEKHLQGPLARFTFGPSIFILAQKKG
jgi:ubiquinone/menaquinone biosynthesis C-methylase UbiE